MAKAWSKKETWQLYLCLQLKAATLIHEVSGLKTDDVIEYFFAVSLKYRYPINLLDALTIISRLNSNQIVEFLQNRFSVEHQDDLTELVNTVL